MKKSQKNHKSYKILTLLLLLVVSFALLSTVSAAITAIDNDTVCDEVCIEYGDLDPDTGKRPCLETASGVEDEYGNLINGNCVNKAIASTTTDANFGDTAMTVISTALEHVLKFAGGGTFSAIGTTIVALAGVMLIVLNALFSVGTGNWASAMPDSIVFNKVPFMDANFVNPHDNSFWNILEVGSSTNVASNLFESLRAVAIAIMIIAAMITGLKLALSTIAAKKAQYKEAVMKWVAGFAILVCLKWLIAGVFYINELLVANFAATASSNDFSIPIYLTDAVPFVGKLLTDITKWVSKLWGGDGTPLSVPGFWGIVFANMLRGIGGDIVSAVVSFVIVGQSFVIVFAYFKRLFMCFILGIVSPLIVAVDTITGITGGKSTIFQSWLKNFIFTVFTQSFHAAYMVVAFMILKVLYTNPIINYTMQAIITIFILTGLVKMEKMLKAMFGFGDGMASLSDGQKGLKNAMGAAAGMAKAGKALGDNKAKSDAASKRRETATANKQNILKEKELTEKRDASSKAALEARDKGDDAEFNKHNADYEKYEKELEELKKQDTVKEAINNNSQPQSIDDRLKAAEAEEAQAIKDEKAAKFAMIMGPANLAAGIGIGLGSGDDIGEALFTGGMITSGLDKLAENSGKFAPKSKEERKGGIKKFVLGEASEVISDWKEADGIKGKAGVVKETFIEKNTQAAGVMNTLFSSSSPKASGGGGAAAAAPVPQKEQTVNVTVDVAKISQDISRQLSKAMSGIGEEVGRAIRKELSNIDKNVDNE